MHKQMIQALILVILRSQPDRKFRDDEIFQTLATRNTASKCTLRDIQETLPDMVKNGVLIEHSSPPYKLYELGNHAVCPLTRDQAQFCAPI